MKPDPVRIDGFLTSNAVSCNRRVQWQRLDTGHCPVEYNIEFKDNCGNILGNVTDIGSNISFYCTDDYADSYSVIMWASRNGVRGTKSQVAVLLTTPKAVPTNAKGMHAGLIFFGFFYHLKGFKEKDFTPYYKNTLKTQRSRTLNPSEVYIKLLPKKTYYILYFSINFNSVCRAFNQV